MMPTTPPLTRRGTDVFIALTRDGRVVSEAALDRLGAAASAATDCFLFCHGWLTDEEEARLASARFFALLDTVLAPARERVVPLRLALYWPSKPFAAPERAGPSRSPRVNGVARGAPGDGLWPEFERRVSRPTRGVARGDAADLLLDVARTLIPASPEEEAELDLLVQRLRGGAEDPRGGLLMSPFYALSFWTMKRRAGEVGERFGRERLAPLWRSLGRAPRLHLVGHSFGAKVVTSAVLGGAPAESLTLLLGAFSAFAFAPKIPRFDRPGLYCGLLAERRVQGPIAVLRSEHDTALATFYSALSGSGEVGRRRNGAPGPRRGALTEPVATSALGAVGARGVGAPELDLVDVQRTGIPEYPIVNVDGSRIVRARELLIGAHRDIDHREVATLVAMTAGLLAGGPDGARPRPLDPRVAR
jgi:hypothetical protein